MKEPLLALALLKKGVNFESPDKMPTRLILLLLGNKDKPGLQLRLLAHICRMVKETKFVEKVKKAKNEHEACLFFTFRDSLYFLGLFLGKRGLNVLSPGVLAGLNPLINLGSGWMGFLFGFQLERRYLRRFPPKYIGLSFLQSVIVIFLVYRE